MDIDASVVELDQQLHSLVSGINVLSAVQPINYAEQKAAFFAGHYRQSPEFLYGEHRVDPFAVKRALFNLPFDKIRDADIQQLYMAVVDAYTDKIDQFRSIGSPEFLYDSLRYFGEPSLKDIRNAQFILHLPDNAPQEDPTIDSQGMISLLRTFASEHGYQYDLKVDNNMIANALVSGTTVKVNGAAKVSNTEAQALAHHELGVHLVTTLNSRKQKLRILSLGFPLNTKTQEGMAILSEYLAGCLTIRRLKNLALRVLAVESMLKEKNFRKTFLLLKEEFAVPDEQAFTITARVYRGGGFTKDYMYLQGFHRVLNSFEKEANFNLLLMGKTSIDYLPLLSKLVDKGVFAAPSLITPSFVRPATISETNRYIAHAIR